MFMKMYDDYTFRDFTSHWHGDMVDDLSDFATREILRESQVPKAALIKTKTVKSNPRPSPKPVVEKPVPKPVVEKPAPKPAPPAPPAEETGYVEKKITEKELDDAAKIFTEDFKKRFVGAGKAVSIDDAMKIATVAFKVGFKYADGKHPKQILK